MVLVVTLLIAGGVLLFAEAVLPGLIAGALGVTCLVAGVAMSYRNFGPSVGRWVLCATLAGLGGMGAMISDSMSADAAAQQADKRQGAINAAASGTVAPAAASVYSAPTTPISTGGQQYFATGGLTSLAKGGRSVRLEDSDYIVPADVVSALGNGSTKAGAQYLDEQLARLNQVSGIGALPEAQKIRSTRMKKKKAA